MITIYSNKENKKNLESIVYYKIVKLFIIAFFLFLHTSNPLYAEEKRPKIGLVLSGGGAKGIAHIGILKTLEEVGLTPDYITGTSMGSIIGGLYSIGYSANELEELVTTINWDEFLTNKIPMDKVAIEEKDYYGRYLLNFFMQDKKLSLPKGVIDGQALVELFSRLTRPVHGINDFNDFPIPYSCVATDIVTGLPVTLDKGSLAMAMRASMAIPSIFTPVKIDDHLLVDGGLVRNFPVQEVIDMGADIIIGVFVSSDLAPESEMTSAIAVLQQSAWVTSAFDTREQMKKVDILIEPDLKGYSTASFTSANGILERGNDAGKDYYDILKNLADSLNNLGDLHAVRQMDVRDSYPINEIEVVGNQFFTSEFIVGKLRLKQNEEITIDHIEEQINVLFGTLYFEKIWYEIIGTNAGYILRLHVYEKPKTELKFSYHYDTENKGGVLGNITLRNMLFKGSRFVFEADLAVNPGFWMDYFKYLGKGQNVALRLTGIWDKSDLPLYDSLGNNVSLFKERDVNLIAGIQTTRTQNNTFGANIRWSNTSFKPKVASEDIRTIEKVVYKSTSLNVFFRRNSLNRRYYPTRGSLVDVTFRSVFQVDGELDLTDSVVVDPGELNLDTDRIQAIHTSYTQYIPAGKKFAFSVEATMNISNLESNTLNFSEYFYIGGFFPRRYNFSPYLGGNQREFVAANFFYTAGQVQYEVVRNLFLKGMINYLDSEYPMKWVYHDLDATILGDRYRRFGYGFAAGFNSILGPINLAFAKDSHRKGWQTFFSIGFIF
jgi:NTE family protein